MVLVLAFQMTSFPPFGFLTKSRDLQRPSPASNDKRHDGRCDSLIVMSSSCRISYPFSPKLLSVAFCVVVACFNYQVTLNGIINTRDELINQTIPTLMTGAGSITGAPNTHSPVVTTAPTRHQLGEKFVGFITRNCW